MSIDRPDLAAAFTGRKPPVDRAAGLSGLLPPARPKPTPVPATSDVDHAPEPGHSEQVPQPAPRAVARKEQARTLRTLPTTKTPISETADTVTNVAVYLEPDLLERARSHRRSQQITYDELVVDAFAAVPDHELQHALAPHRALSTLTGMPTRQRRHRGIAGIQVQLRLTGPQRHWLDQKQQTVEAPSRSALVAAALKLYLTD